MNMVMKKKKRLFNHDKFGDVLEDIYGSGYITHFAKDINLSRTSVSEWLNEKKPNGPGAGSWNKIEPVLLKKGVPFKRRDFYIQEPYESKEASTTTIEDPKTGYPKDDKQINRDLENEVAHLKKLLHDRNETIASLVEENRALRAELKELKAEIKKLKKK